MEAELSRVDPLTGAFNYRGFIELMGLEVSLLQRFNKPFSLAYLDIDNFKTVNDTYGHKAGDKLLQSVVQEVKEHLRKTNIIGRMGGDEFTLFMPGANIEAAQVVIDKMKRTLIETFRSYGWPVTLSIGVVSCADGKCDLERMITQADDLMYEVKHSGKDNVRFGEYRQFK
jgi:diguanylate cyclase (GGDEF)-like protein